MRNVIDRYPDPGRHTVSHRSLETQTKDKEPAFKFMNYESQLKIRIRNQNDSANIPVVFSEHFTHIITFEVHDMVRKILSPKIISRIKLRVEIIMDNIFKERLKGKMAVWERVRDFQDENTSGSLMWWEKLVKPGIKKLALERNREINKEKREKLNLLNIRQAYLTAKLQNGELFRLPDLNLVHHQINEY